MTTPAPAPGPRQTLDRCCHPTLGEGVAVYANGPAYFAADSGEVVPMREMRSGGWSKDKGSWLAAIDQNGARVELDVTGRERGTRWERVVGQQHGAGWLGQGGRKHPTLGYAMWNRFEPDDGKPFEFWIDAMWVGLPCHDPEKKRKKKEQDRVDAECRACPWMSFRCIDGSFFVHQREEDYRPDVEVAAPAAGPVQMGLPL